MVLGLAFTACGDDEDDPSPSATPTSADDGTQSEPEESDALGSDPFTAVSGADICAGLSSDAVSTALDVDAEEGAPYDTATPQCTYSFTSDSGASSTITVASMRPDGDLGDRAGDEAFDYVLEVNRGLAADFEEVTLEAGDRSARLTGETLHLGVVATGGHLLTITVPADGVEASLVDALTDEVANTFA